MRYLVFVVFIFSNLSFIYAQYHEDEGGCGSHCSPHRNDNGHDEHDAHGRHHHHHGHDAKPTTLREFVELAHHEMEIGDPHSSEFSERIKSALLSLNPKRVFLEAKRWHNMRSVDPQFGEHAKNLAFLLPMSEALEMATGPAVTWLVLNTDLPRWIEGLMVTGGYAVSIPFVVEPYCMTVIAAYAALKPFRDGVTFVRASVTRSVSGFCEITGAKKFFNYVLPQTEILTEFMEQGWFVYQDLATDRKIHLYYETEEGNLVEMTIGDMQGLYVEALHVHGLGRADLKKILTPLNWSARELLLFQIKGDGEYNFRPREILLKSKRHLCSSLLKLPHKIVEK